MCKTIEVRIPAILLKPPASGEDGYRSVSGERRRSLLPAPLEWDLYLS
jgi:hypothetical protein